ncbi:MAG: hypothetical protein ACJ8DQ_13655 [Xanthobacteraceae bacterium]
MNEYDPFTSPDPEEWLALDEQERVDLVENYHRRKRIRLPSSTVHAIIHAVVENQIALGEQVPIRTLQRLMSEGLDRHDAIHAIGSVLIVHLSELMRQVEAETTSDADPNAPYYAELERLTAKSWRESG